MSHEVYECSTLGPFPFAWNTDANLDVFKRAFLHVWDVLPIDCKTPIQQFCSRVVYASRIESLVPGLGHAQNGTAGIADFYENRRSAVRIKAVICRESTFDGVCNIIAHELRHCWQHATDWRATLPVDELAKAQAVRIAIENDACEFAESLGFSPDSVWRLGNLPDDPQFASLIDSWPLLNPETRQTLAQAATDEAAAMREGVKLCWTDRRFLDIRDTWEFLNDDQRDDLVDILRREFSGQRQ